MSKRFEKWSLIIILGTIAATSHRVDAQVARTSYHGTSTTIQDFGPARQWVTADRVLHIRNWKQIAFDDASDPRMRGNYAVTINLDFQLAPLPTFGYGRMWGTVRLENDGGVWIGTWEGRRTTQGHSFFRSVMKGQGGYAGLHAIAEYSRRTPVPYEPFEFVGTILETPAK